MRRILENIYHLMMEKLPFRLMHKRYRMDTQHDIWIPRWGYSKKQLSDADDAADKLNKNIKWE